MCLRAGLACVLLVCTADGFVPGSSMGRLLAGAGGRRERVLMMGLTKKLENDEMTEMSQAGKSMAEILAKEAADAKRKAMTPLAEVQEMKEALADFGTASTEEGEAATAAPTERTAGDETSEELRRAADEVVAYLRSNPTTAAKVLEVEEELAAREVLEAEKAATATAVVAEAAAAAAASAIANVDGAEAAAAVAAETDGGEGDAEPPRSELDVGWMYPGPADTSGVESLTRADHKKILEEPMGLLYLKRDCGLLVDAATGAPYYAPSDGDAKMTAAYPLAPAAVREAHRLPWGTEGGLTYETLLDAAAAAAAGGNQTMRDWVGANRDFLGVQMRDMLTNVKLHHQSRGDWRAARDCHELRRAFTLADSSLATPFRQLLLDAENRLRANMQREDGVELWAGEDPAEVSAMWSVLKAAEFVWAERLLEERANLAKLIEADANAGGGESGRGAAAARQKAQEETVQQCEEYAASWRSSAGAFSTSEGIARKLRPEMAFLERAFAMATPTEVRKFATEEFCPPSGISPGQLRELLRGYAESLELCEAKSYIGLLRRLRGALAALSDGTEDDAARAVNAVYGPAYGDLTWQVYNIRTNSRLIQMAGTSDDAGAELETGGPGGSNIYVEGGAEQVARGAKTQVTGGSLENAPGWLRAIVDVDAEMERSARSRGVQSIRGSRKLKRSAPLPTSENKWFSSGSPMCPVVTDDGRVLAPAGWVAAWHMGYAYPPGEEPGNPGRWR